MRDSVQGDIRLLKEEIAFIDTPEFQRLRHVRQLGMVYLVYPGAQHTRFEHSLGTLQEAQRIIDAINTNPLRHIGLDESQVRLTRLCALLHDVSHVPFGHSIEDELRVLKPHDASEAVIGTALAPLQSEIDSYGRDYGWGFRSVVKCLAKQADGMDKVIQEIVTDTISADLRDYLKRDFHYTGLPFRIDDRILRYFFISEDGGQYHLTIDLDKEGAVRRDCVSEILYLLRLRYLLGERVYYHPTKIAASTMVARALQELSIPDRKELLNVQGFLSGFGDDELIRQLATSGNKLASRLGYALRDRRLYAPCWAWLGSPEDFRQRVVDKFADPASRRTWENETARALGGQEGQVLVYCPPAGMSFKEAKVYVNTRYNVLPFIDCGSQFGIEQVINSLRTDYTNLWCFYVFIDPALAVPKPDGYQRLEETIRAKLRAKLRRAVAENQLPDYKKKKFGVVKTQQPALPVE